MAEFKLGLFHSHQYFYFFQIFRSNIAIVSFKVLQISEGEKIVDEIYSESKHLVGNNKVKFTAI